MYRNLNEGKHQTIEVNIFNWTIANGMAQTDDVAFRTRENRVGFQGAIDLRRRRYDGFTLGVLDNRGCAELTKEIKNPLSNPAVKEIGLVETLAGPLAGVLSKTLELPDLRKCRPLYAGQVTHPQK
jgi:hypothetical protein